LGDAKWCAGGVKAGGLKGEKNKRKITIRNIRKKEGAKLANVVSLGR